VHDFLTGDWLFKTCIDKEIGKVLIKAVKCPAGARFAQLEGNTMVFQRSLIDNLLYDIVSLTAADENDKLSRRIAASIDEIPDVIKDNFDIKSYQEATGKTAPGKNIVTLCKAEDEKSMITLFLLERAWTLSASSPEERLKALEEQERQRPESKKKEIDTGQIWKCPICGDQFRLKHIERETTTKHSLKKSERLLSEKRAKIV
jgi:ribosomal protein L37AE/L43A